MTKEAAALETVAAMGWEQFTIKMLQEAIGLSYQQTYRILNGYASRGATHSGLLEKCPAVSYFDTMVTEDGEGYAVRRREHLFSFDRAVYRRWAFGGGDRDDGPGPSDSFSISAGLPRDFSTGREREGGGNGSGSHSTSTDRETRLSLSTGVQQQTHPDAGAGAGTGAGVCGCDRQNGESDPAMSAECGERRERMALCDHLNVAACRKVLKDGGGADRGLHDPLPGVLDHTEFSRVTTDLGRCTLCGEGRAMFVSEDRRMQWCRAGRFPPTRR